MILLPTVALVGSFLCGFGGMSPGATYGPILLILGIETRVAIATAVYMAMITTLSSTI